MSDAWYSSLSPASQPPSYLCLSGVWNPQSSLVSAWFQLRFLRLIPYGKDRKKTSALASRRERSQSVELLRTPICYDAKHRRKHWVTVEHWFNINHYYDLIPSGALRENGTGSPYLALEKSLSLLELNTQAEGLPVVGSENPHFTWCKL